MLHIDTVMGWKIEPVEQTITDTDCLLYALSLGYGRDPLDRTELPFVYEQGLRVVPSIASVLARPPFWMRDPATGIDWVKIVHGEQIGHFHKPVPVGATVVGETRVTGIDDKGTGRGALVYTETQIWNKATGDLVAVNARSTFCRGDGGCGSAGTVASQAPTQKDRAPDAAVTYETQPGQALLYRLNGDRNPLHSDPDIARKAGFERPILHGLCTWGIACRALLALCCENDPARLKSLRARFSAPVMPGDSIETRIWREGTGVAFESRVPGRDVTVLKGGYADVAA
ncbi:3-alpha,7-alpha,12-alpha-trihydroxy-5-beta-cholest-24-enoyl-CoA hydratase [Pararhodobacter marinus]|uniref:3-alpha,7-alpha, 12-alpha-trihydroxy-5-beta-cholest-24-enoyl-CoA hydratase n=1 Tax=Pararhodobacter marinus TaxID=2184063 RepID=A0A2U2CHV5_9RHOB|nr:MaoC/PaaZ C-terminal domain-containing protein [Pararhodobacter marinus]PWE31456.1 3-alpha,7-alpha,12-alpha-trihydroxy-5-beta-cholest-24-enoyl-CoA hydratase [Pararhodobacter marinus]